MRWQALLLPLLSTPALAQVPAVNSPITPAVTTICSPISAGTAVSGTATETAFANK